ncbi:MAG: hypothetical protein SF162_11045 [bacterium]|nr:hypothetical protein [bacterium]
MMRQERSFTKIVVIAVLIALFSIAAVGSVAAQEVQPLASCAGSLANRLNTVGQTGRVVRQFSTLRAAPAGAPTAFIVTPAEFIVTTPPDNGVPFRCAVANGVDLYFIYVEYTSAPYTGLRGWANESQINSPFGVDQYWLEPFTPAPVEPDCSASLPNQLNTIGQTGAIAEVFSTLRTSPGGEGVRVDAPASFVVAQPPEGGAPVVCVGGLVYVYIQYQDGEAAGDAGWATESERVSIFGFDRYWIEPAG